MTLLKLVDMSPNTEPSQEEVIHHSNKKSYKSLVGWCYVVLCKKSMHNSEWALSKNNYSCNQPHTAFYYRDSHTQIRPIQDGYHPTHALSSPYWYKIQASRMCHHWRSHWLHPCLQWIQCWSRRLRPRHGRDHHCSPCSLDDMCQDRWNQFKLLDPSIKMEMNMKPSNYLPHTQSSRASSNSRMTYMKIFM